MKNPFLPNTETDWQSKSQFMPKYSKWEWEKEITFDYGLDTVIWWEFNIVESTFFPYSPFGYSVMNCDFDYQLVSVCNRILFFTFPF
jgi:hypothetical protein